MTNPTPLPWAVLLCKFKDDANDPSKVRLGELYNQWVAKYGMTWVAANLTQDAALDPRTILELYQDFFTVAGAGTYNAVRYWDEMSHGTIDVGGSRVFPCTLDMTIADGAAQAQSPGGAQYQNMIFQKAKQALSNQYGVDWKDFYGVAVSFQSPDFGAQGGWYDNGPGVYMDVRFLRNQGVAAWGQEMGHAFGLDHSRQDGSNVDYQDMWDTMSTMTALCYTSDANYGLRGIGLNAWNMRGRQWLDESRIWKGPASADFSSSVVLRPLHRRDLPGYLGAELPAIGTDSAYLVEFRVPEDWDSNIATPTVLVHRFEGPIGQFLGTHSYLKKGTRNQLALSVGDVFTTGTGPFVRAQVASIDATNHTATIQLCHSSAAEVVPAVKIKLLNQGWSCAIPPVEGSPARFSFSLSNVQCQQNYHILWGAAGAMPVQGAGNNGPTFSIVAPAPSVPVTVSVAILFADGSTISDSYAFHSISEDQAIWMLLICKLRQDATTKPIPWWQWDPEKVRDIAKQYSEMEFGLIGQRVQQVTETLGQLGGYLRVQEHG